LINAETINNFYNFDSSGWIEVFIKSHHPDYIQWLNDNIKSEIKVFYISEYDVGCKFFEYEETFNSVKFYKRKLETAKKVYARCKWYQIIKKHNISIRINVRQKLYKEYVKKFKSLKTELHHLYKIPDVDAYAYFYARDCAGYRTFFKNKDDAALTKLFF